MTPHDVRRAYDAQAARYDVRWATYNDRGLALLRPWVEDADLGDVVDVGCGTANLLPRLARWGARYRRWLGLDPSPGMLAVARPRVLAAPPPAALLCAAAEAIPLRSASADTVVSASSLHYWSDAALALAEIRRVLRPGGRLLLLDWSRDPLRMKAMDAWLRLTGDAYARVYTAAGAHALLARAGLRVTRESRGAAGPVWRLMAFEAVAT